MGNGDGIPENDFISRRDFGKLIEDSDFDDFKDEFGEDISVDDFKKQIEDFNFEKSKKNPEDFIGENGENISTISEEPDDDDDDDDDDSNVSEILDNDDSNTSEVPDDDLDDKNKKHKVKVDGQEYEVTLEDLIKSYQLDAHITKKSQEVSKNIKDSQEIFNRVVNYNEQVKQLESQILADHDEWLAEHLDEDEAKEYKTNIENRKKQEQIDYSNFMNGSMAELIKIHPDAADLDRDEDFIAYRQRIAPMIQPQHIAVYGPLALAPLMTAYKENLELKKQIDEAKDVSIKKREEEEKRKKEQSEKKKKSQTIKPNSSGSTPPRDDQKIESDVEYLKRMQGRRGNRGLLDI